MSITVNTNLSSMIAQRSLYKATNKMNTALQRLSTGARINSSKDDASGSAISTKLGYKISSYNVAKDNAQMGQSMLETANGSLSQINSMLQRIRDLSEQASNGTYGMDERKAMQAEIDGLTEEIYRIKNTTEFNGKKILGEEEKKGLSSIPTMSMADIDVENITQAEWDSNYKGQVIGISNSKELQKIATLTNDKLINSSGTTFALTADINLDELGNLDDNGSNWTAIGCYDANISDYHSFNGNFDGNGHTISNLKINKSTENYQGLFGHVENSTIKNVNLINCDVSGYECVGGLVSDIYFSIIENCNISGNLSGQYYIGGIGGYTSTESNIKNCSFTGIVEGFDIYNDSCFIGGLIGYAEFIPKTENCYVSAEVSGNSEVGQFIGYLEMLDENSEISNCYYDKSKSKGIDPIGTNDTGEEFNVKPTSKNPFTPPEMSVMTNLQVGVNSDSNSTISVDTGFSLNDFKVSVLEENDARESLSKIDEMMNKVTAKMTEIGSAQNRLESTMEFQDVQISALTSANSLIKDADIAEESSNYIKNQILQNVTSSLLATANQNPSIALQLL